MLIESALKVTSVKWVLFLVQEMGFLRLKSLVRVLWLIGVLGEDGPNLEIRFFRVKFSTILSLYCYGYLSLTL